MPHISIINYGFVLLYGIILTLSFAGIEMKKNIKQYVAIFCTLGIVQIIAYFFLGVELLYKSYPFLTHLPLFLVLKIYNKKSSYIAGISVLSAYLFCTPRKWLGTAISFFWNYDINVSYLVQIIITIPLLVIVIKYVSSYVVRLSYESNRILRLFITVPLVYYVIEYIFTVYTDLLYQGGAAIVELMDAAVVVVYFIYSIIYLKTLYEKKEMEVSQALFKVMVDQSKSEIEVLRKSQEQTAIYRHDLRHHLNYINACIADHNIEDARAYIAEICKEIDKNKITRFSENESVNLILSSYAAKAADKEIQIDINVSTMDFGRFSTLELCSLLSNALENAIHACEAIAESNKRFIKLRMYSKNNKLCIDIRNSYQKEPQFQEGIPISKEQGHGYGTKSMAHVVEKYSGIYQFSVNDGVFIFQSIT